MVGGRGRDFSPPSTDIATPTVRDKDDIGQFPTSNNPPLIFPRFADGSSPPQGNEFAENRGTGVVEVGSGATREAWTGTRAEPL
ncbi:unnamed protein product [Boreogadus saida]